MTLAALIQASWEDDDAEDEADRPDVRPVEHAGYAGHIDPVGEDLKPGDIAPHHENEEVADHVLGHTGDELRDMSTPARVPLHEPVYATQSHVTEPGLAKYRDSSAKPGKDLPRFIKHQGRLYVDDGHHRVGGALMRGDSHIDALLYDADKHGFPEPKNKWW